MKNLFLKMCKALLALLGVTVVACDTLPVRDEYGSPTMDYTVMGKVVNADKEGLDGIKVTPLFRSYNGGADSAYTDVSGNFRLAQEMSPGFGESVQLVFEDEEDVYRTDTIKVGLKQVKKGDRWYSGVFEAKDVEIIMREKN